MDAEAVKTLVKSIETDNDAITNLILREYHRDAFKEILIYAAKNGFLKTLKFFAKKDYGVCFDNDIVLRSAFGAKEEDTQHEILEYLSTISEYKDNFHQTILSYASSENNVNMIKYVAETETISPSFCGDMLTDAIRCQSNDVVKYLVQKIDFAPKDLRYVIKTCAECDNYACIKFFIGNKWNFDQEVKDELISYAIEYDHLDLIQLMKKHNYFDLKKIDQYFITACASGYVNILKYIIRLNGGIHTFSTETLNRSFSLSRSNTIKFLLQIGANSTNALLEAANRGNLNLVAFAIRYGADPRTHNDKALSSALRGGYYHVAKFLVSWGCNVLTNRNALIYPSSSSIQVSMYFFTSVSKRDQFTYREILESSMLFSTAKLFHKTTKLITRRLSIKRNHFKNNLLKFILKPNSLHMQLSSIE
jgi:ankyrin repeat protein